jgi:hypothetical protein
MLIFLTQEEGRSSSTQILRMFANYDGSRFFLDPDFSVDTRYVLVDAREPTAENCASSQEGAAFEIGTNYQPR